MFRRRCMRFSTASSQSPVWIDKKDDVAILHLNAAGAVNLGNAEFMSAFPTALDTLQTDESVRAIVIYSDKSGNFFAGADIGMLAACKTAEEASLLAKTGQDVLNRVAQSKKLVVAAIHGSCMGLGTELALACHMRVATNSPKTQFSLPEVQLGLLPGAGGTQRLPRLIGLQASLDIALTGAPVKAAKAKKLGLVDVLVEPLGPGLASAEENTMRYLRDVAVEKAHEIANTGNGKFRRADFGFLANFTTFNPVGRWAILNIARRATEKATRGNYPAVPKILECIETGLKEGMDAGLKVERKEFGNLAATKESAALRSIFFGTQSLKKNRFGQPPREIKTIAVVGAGLMGAGIADVSINKAHIERVILKDTSLAGLQRGQAQIVSNLENQLKKKKINSTELEARLSHLKGGITYAGFEKADLVVEAVFEDLKVKHKVIQELEAVVPSNCVIATNTSALPIADIAKGASRPQNVVGMHYFSPVDKMLLLEVITHKGTSREAASIAVNTGIKQGKHVIVVKDGPGFYTTRILMPFVSEAVALVQSGLSPHHVDAVIRQFGFPVGPCTLADEVGLDVGLHIAKYLGSVWPERLGGNVSALEEFVNAGFNGRKSGKGFYVYESDKNKKKKGLISSLTSSFTQGGGKELNEKALKILQANSHGDTHITDPDLALRLVSRMANEAVECLREGILDNPTDGDIGAVFGLGFPPFLGGPFRWIDTFGARTLVRHMEGFANKLGPQFKPSPLLVEYAEQGKKFHKN